MENDPKVALCFSIMNKTVPVDHGFDLYSCISRVLPFFHEAKDVGLKLIRGRYIGDGLLSIQPNSRLVLRLRSTGLSPYINLAGNSLDLRGHIKATTILTDTGSLLEQHLQRGVRLFYANGILVALGIGVGLGFLLGASSRRTRTGRFAKPVVHALSDIALEFLR